MSHCRFSLLMMVMSAPAIKDAFRSFDVSTQTAKVKCFRCCHFLISAGYVSLATRSGATTRMRWASKLSNNRSTIAVREMTVFPRPISSRTAATGFISIIIDGVSHDNHEVRSSSPVLVSKAMDYMHGHSDKFIIIVMDGMSEFDWNIISSSFTGLQYEKSSMFAMIPSTTSVSRQCLLAGKYPSQLLEPWKQSKEKTEFVNCTKDLGYSDTQIGYERGYDAQFGSFVKCGAIIINDVDDMVHAQTQGRLGMFNDITVLANQKKLLEMTQRFLSAGYDVYITADHGNTTCTGLGKLMGTGVEVETKSRRMVVLKDFADKAGLIENTDIVEYPKYYHPKGI